jgi:glutathione S-transferase
MSADRKLVFFHGPKTRSTGVFILLEELGAPYELRLVNMKVMEHRQSAYLAINPMGKVPAILHGDALVTEQGAIYIYLADYFAKAGLAPAIDDPLRGAYLRWLVFYGSCVEPACVDKAMKREPGTLAMSPYGTFEAMLETIVAQLRKGPWLLGERFSAADILYGTALGWMTKFGIVPALPEIMDYISRVGARPSFAKVNALDAQYAAEHEAIAKAQGKA